MKLIELDWTRERFDELSPWKDMRRCAVAPDHTVVGYHHPEDTNKWEDGTEVNWQDYENNGWNCMVEIPKFYYQKKLIEDEGREFLFFVSSEPFPEGKIHPAYFRDRTKYLDDSTANPIEVDYRYIGAFHGWIDGQNRLRSLPYKMPVVNKTIGSFRNNVKNNGVGWSQFDYYLLYAIQLLYIVEYGHPDSQLKIGRGYVDDNVGPIQTGGTLVYGNNTFGETTGKYQMSYRGIEDLWGNLYNFIDGLYSNLNRQLTVSNKGFNNTGSGYTTIGPSFSNDLDGYIKDIQDHEEAGFIIGSDQYGDENSGLCDHGYLREDRLALFGGHFSNGSTAGIFRLRLSRVASFSDEYVTARLAL